MTRLSPRRWAVWLLAMVLVSAALACNAAGLSSGEGSEATVESVYATITAQSLTAEPGGDAVTATAAPGDDQDDVEPGLTPQAPNARPGNGEVAQVPPCTGSITIDGLLGDASSAASLSLSANTFGSGQWGGASDLSGEARLCWTERALYLAVDVTDDVHVQNQTGRNMWRGDEVEVVFDADLQGDYYAESWNSDDTQLGLSPGDFSERSPEAVMYRPDVRSAGEIDLAAQGDGSGGYTLEAAIPWSLLRATPESGKVFGFCVALSDNDQEGEASQDSMVSHCPRLLVSNPTTWSTLELLGQ